jgi:endonuclease-8
MPEGPLLILYRDDLAQLIGLTLEEATTKLRTADLTQLEGRALTGITTWGKYLFMQFGEALHLRIHWGMFGIYYLDSERKGKEPTAVLTFSSERILRLYSVSMRVLDGAPSETEYDPRADVMNARWDLPLALQKLRALPEEAMVCDALLDQSIFAGLGNAIKTEALFALKIHPESRVHLLPSELLEALVEEAVGQSQLFLEGKRAFCAERYGWTLAYCRKECPRCGTKISVGHTGALQRKSHWCESCAVKWA